MVSGFFWGEIMTIFIGSDEASALQKATDHFGVSQDQLQVQVLQTARRGFLGIGKRPAKINVTVKEHQASTPDKQPIPARDQQPAEHPAVEQDDQPAATQPVLTPEERAQREMAENHQHNLEVMKAAAQGLQDYLQAIYQQLGIKVQPEIKAMRAHDCTINLVTEKTGQVVGYHGRRLNAVEQLGAAYLNYHGVKDVELVLDTGDYRAKRRATLDKIMERSVTQVIATNQAVFLDPMPARERKYLHKLAENNDQVRTYSHGREPFRSIVIAPQN